LLLLPSFILFLIFLLYLLNSNLVPASVFMALPRIASLSRTWLSSVSIVTRPGLKYRRVGTYC
jgi:hypothetical protein